MERVSEICGVLTANIDILNSAIANRDVSSTPEELCVEFVECDVEGVWVIDLNLQIEVYAQCVVDSGYGTAIIWLLNAQEG